MPLVKIPDGTKAISAYLRDREEVAAIVGRRVVTKTPEDMSTPWVRVTRLNARSADGGRADHLQEFLMQFDCYAGADRIVDGDRVGGFPEASELGRVVRAVLKDISSYRGGDAIFSGSRIVGDTSLPDDTVGEPARERTVITANVWGHASPAS